MQLPPRTSGNVEAALLGRVNPREVRGKSPCVRVRWTRVKRQSTALMAVEWLVESTSAAVV